ncbi:Gfo/Idh/MocA family protein [Petrimonas sp.]|uniref:Gfo/Idh/MocA family protein n=1 Tax=Petrimonas sp. TaxID=2023866 RepID=UPI003F511266
MKVLIIGLGSIACKHIQALKELDTSVELLALRSSIDATIFDGIKNIFHFEDIQAEKPDFIIISNPTSLHFETLKNVSSLGIPLFIEKPLFDEVNNEKNALVKEISILGIPTYVACNLRFLDALKEIKRIITQERVNEVNIYCGSYLPNWRPGVDYKTVYSANKEMGGGVHIDLIHELDYVYWIFGKPQETHSVFKNNSSLNIFAYDYANYLWEYDNFCASIVLNYYRRDAKRELEIVCESGTYIVNLLKNTIVYNGQLIFESLQQIKDTYKEQLAFFIHSVINQKETFNSIEEAYNVLNLCITE